MEEANTSSTLLWGIEAVGVPVVVHFQQVGAAVLGGGHRGRRVAA